MILIIVILMNILNSQQTINHPTATIEKKINSVVTTLICKY